MKKAIVIGSGFGGLAIACRLRKKNFDVTVLEKQSNFGGRARALEHNGFIYDAGPTVITAPYLIEELFTMHDKNWSDYYELIKQSAITKPYYYSRLKLKGRNNKEYKRFMVIGKRND